MKKLLLLFAGLALLTTGCKDETPAVPKYSIVGTWKPVKMVDTEVTNNTNTPVSETFIYDTCEQESRWTFNSDKSGHKMIKKMINSQCVIWEDQNFTYDYNASTGDITVKYITFNDKGKVLDLAENSMNLKIEETTPNVYHSQTYTLVRVTQ